MSDPNRPTAAEIELINAHSSPPRVGQIVHALNRGGCLCFNHIWRADSIEHYDAWMPSPKVPPDVKAIQLARLKVQ